MTEPKVSERIKSMVREMLKEIRHDSRFNVMDYDSVDHILSSIAEIEQRAEKWKEAAVSAEHIFLGYEALEEADLDTEGAVDRAERLVTQAIERNNAAKKALGAEWDQAVKGEG